MAKKKKYNKNKQKQSRDSISNREPLVKHKFLGAITLLECGRKKHIFSGKLNAASALFVSKHRDFGDQPLKLPINTVFEDPVHWQLWKTNKGFRILGSKPTVAFRCYNDPGRGFHKAKLLGKLIPVFKMDGHLEFADCIDITDQYYQCELFMSLRI